MWRARYGESTTPTCPLCERSAIIRNAQGVPVCTDHKTTQLSAACPNCAAPLELREGKFGPFFLCTACGPISMKKANLQRPASARAQQRAQAYKDENGRDAYVRSDDPRFEFR